MSFLFSALAALVSVSPQQRANEPVIVPQREHYPADALAANAQGEIPITLKVAADGSLRCTLRDKDAPPLLRRPSCLLVVQRWVFPPRKGESELDLIVRWRINPIADDATRQDGGFGGAVPLAPERWFTNADYPAAAAFARKGGTVRLDFDITAAGTIENCTATSGETGLAAKRLCASASSRGLLLPALGSDGKPRATRGSLRINLVAPR